MKETYWIDGYNLLFYLEQESPLEKNRNTLLKTLNELVEQTRIEAIIVFDSSQQFSKTRFHSLEVIYAPPGQTADDYILEDIEMKKRKKGHFFVVTNDKHLSLEAKFLKVQVMKVPEFIKHLIKKAKKPKPAPVASIKLTIKDREIERLVKIFEERLRLYEEGKLD